MKQKQFVKSGARFAIAAMGAMLMFALAAIFRPETGRAQAAASPSTKIAAPVAVTETDETIQTYLEGPPEPNPMFYYGKNSQGAEGRIYPYPLHDNLTNVKSEKTYHLIYLENEYVKIAVLPEIGGRLFSAVDKTNNYDFVYHQHVIKPALIGLLGAWISGGIEWNIPHHHRASTFSPVQWKIEEKADGSKTVWVGELEVRQRMRWNVGYTLRPGSSVMECSVRIVNRTPEPHSMLCFANVAVNANENYQIIFPPSTQLVTYHGKNQFTAWPIADSRFNGNDVEGVDVSWYKNHQGSNSMFAWNYTDDFYAGYDHGKNAGTMSIADHHVVPGKKFWTWGNGPRGKQWDQILTDDDGPYVELMVGAYSDNQPDYSWLEPYETRSFKMNWYPFRDIGGVKNANLDAAVNLEIDKGVAKYGFNATSAHASATAVLKAGDKILKSESIAIGPDKPYTAQVDIPSGIDEHDVRASLMDGGRELVGYAPLKLAPVTEKPEIVTPPAAPEEIKTVEELYLVGLRIDQFNDPRNDPDPYWEEGLKRDPGDVRCNAAMGMLEIRKAKFAEAEAHLRKALERLTKGYTSPKNAEPYYYLGLALKFQGKDDEAYDAFFKAAWSNEWRGPAYFALAEIACKRGDFETALEHVNRSLDGNAMNLRALTLKAAILRHLGRKAEAADALDVAATRIDPLDARIMAERWLLDPAKANTDKLVATLNQFPEDAQEDAAEYLNAGLWEDGFNVLQAAIGAAPDNTKMSPLVYYYQGYFAEKQGVARVAEIERQTAKQASPDYAFPFQQEAIAVLEGAMNAPRKMLPPNPPMTSIYDPSNGTISYGSHLEAWDSHAPYYLGNLLYDWQPKRAEKVWESAEQGLEDPEFDPSGVRPTLDAAALAAKPVPSDPVFPLVERNLADAIIHEGGEDADARASALLERAVASDHPYALHFYELDQLYQQAGVDPAKRLALMEKHQDVVVKRDDALIALIGLKTFAGKADEAIALLQNRTFSIWEGGNPFNTGAAWTDAHVVRGRQRLAADDAKGALADFQAATAFPENLRANSGLGGGGRRSEIAYWTGAAQDKLGDSAGARQSWTEAARNDAATSGALGAARGGRGGAAGARGSRGGGRGGRGGRGFGGGAGDSAVQQYDQALALAKLGRTEESQAAFRKLVDSGEQAIRQATDAAGGSQAPDDRAASAHLTAALGHLGLKESDQARTELTAALKAAPDMLDAHLELAALK